MLRFLLDEHVSPKIADQLLTRLPGLTAFAIASWEDGAHLGASDEDLLTLAYRQELTLVTYDLKTIAPLLKDFAEQQRSHAGIVFIDTKTYLPNDFGGLVHALEELWLAQGQQQWFDRIVFLSR